MLKKSVPANWMPLAHQSRTRPPVSRVVGNWTSAAAVKKIEPTKNVIPSALEPTSWTYPGNGPTKKQVEPSGEQDRDRRVGPAGGPRSSARGYSSDRGASVRAMIRGRLRRHGAGEGAGSPAEEQVVEIDPAELSGVFNVPGWLRDIGLMAWLLVGVTLLICGLVWLLALTQVITVPVIVAGIVAVVGSPLVAWLQGHHVPRALGAAL